MLDGAAIRSLLFCPGDKARLIEKAIASEADAVIVDLEDAVAPRNKDAARDVTCEALSSAAPGKPVLVRLNAFDTGRTAVDLAAVMPARPWGVVLPKCGGPADIARLAHYLEALEAQNGIGAGSTRILTVATETAAAVLGLASPHGSADQRVWGLLWGGEDLSADLGVRDNRDQTGSYSFPFQHARAQCLYAANALGARAVDAVYTDFRDAEGLERETRAGLRDGFTAKAAIHPAQAAVINRVLTPTASEQDWARLVIELVQAEGAAQIDGKMIDIAHKRIAERILLRAGLRPGSG